MSTKRVSRRTQRRPDGPAFIDCPAHLLILIYSVTQRLPSRSTVAIAPSFHLVNFHWKTPSTELVTIYLSSAEIKTSVRRAVGPDG
jgi:hypothetical protein